MRCARITSALFGFAAVIFFATPRIDAEDPNDKDLVETAGNAGDFKTLAEA